MTLLTQKIKVLLQEREIIPFSEYMSLCLFDEHGYYSRLKALGKHGDFVTGPELGPYLAIALVNFLTSESALEHYPVIVELGGGSGQFAFDILTLLKHHHCLPERYLMIEKSQSLTEAQKQKLRGLGADVFERIEWHVQLDHQQSLSAILIANEFFDALPVERFIKTSSGERRLGVKWDGHYFVEAEMQESLPHEQLSQEMRHTLDGLPEGYCSEICLEVLPTLNTILACFKQGLAIVIDYGSARERYYQRGHHQGSIAAYQQHRAVSVFASPGDSDITAHVDFTSLAEGFIEHGWKVNFLTTQAQFLLENQALPESGINVENYALKRLLEPRLMGEVFKVLVMRRD